VAGPWWDTGALADYVAAGLKKLGHETRLFLYSTDLNAPIGFRDRVRRRLIGDSRFKVERIFESARDDNVRLLEGVQEFKPDLLLVIKGEVFLPETLHIVKNSLSGPLVQWCGDNPFWFPNIIGSLDVYDWFLLTDGHYGVDVEKHGARQVKVLPHAADPDVYSADGEESVNGSDVIFVGDSRHQMGHLPENWHRVEVLESVARSGVDLAIFGRGWETLPSDYAVRNSLRGRTLLPASRVAAAYRASKIVLNVHHPQIVDGCNMRTFEAAACGAFQLVDDRSSLHELFDPPNDLVTYANTDELVELVRHYVDRPDERRTVAAKSRERVLNEHTYGKRLAEMIELVTSSP
jgi:spore maturation protein CgeB